MAEWARYNEDMADPMRQVILIPDREGGGWVAEVPSLPGCMSQGETMQDALRNVRDAIAEWIAAAADEGMTVPSEEFSAVVCAVEPAA